MDYKKNIKRVLKEHGYTIGWIAERMKNADGTIGISQPSLSMHLANTPSVERLLEISELTGIKVSELLGEKQEVIKCPKCGTKLKITIEEG